MRNEEAAAEAVGLGNVVVCAAQSTEHGRAVVLAALVGVEPSFSPSAASPNHELLPGLFLTLHSNLVALSSFAKKPASFGHLDPWVL